MAMNPFQAMAQASFFEGLSEDSRMALARIGFARQVRRGDMLFAEEDSGHSVYFLLQGLVQLFKTSPEGAQTVIKIITPGEFFAEAILFELDRYPAAAAALADSLLLLFPRRDFLRLLSSESFRNDFLALLLRRQRYLANRIHELATGNVQQRLLAFLAEQPAAGSVLTLAMSKKEIAAAIGTTPETLSRLIRRLTRQGLLSWTGRTLTWKGQNPKPRAQGSGPAGT